MNRLFETIKAARWLELTIAAALLCILIVLALNGGGDGNDEEARMQRILSGIDGAGRVRVMIARDAGGNCTGVVVVASGAKDVGVMLRLQRAVQALTQLELAQIEITR